MCGASVPVQPLSTNLCFFMMGLGSGGLLISCQGKLCISIRQAACAYRGGLVLRLLKTLLIGIER